MAIERQDQTGEDQYLLRVVTKQRDGSYVLVANNSDYEDIHVTPEMAEELRTLARLKAVVDPLELVVGESFMREEIPALFGEEYNPGNWNVGHVVLPERKAHVLLVTLNKQGKAEEHRYLDRWVDERTFEWSTQNATTPDSGRKDGSSSGTRSWVSRCICSCGKRSWQAGRLRRSSIAERLATRPTRGARR